jgi:hypothetical protein
VVDQQQPPAALAQLAGGWGDDGPTGTVVRDRNRDATLSSDDLEIDVRTRVLHAIGRQLGGQQQRLVDQDGEVRLDQCGSDNRPSRRRRTAVGRQPDPADHAG